MDKFYARAQPAATEYLRQLAGARKPWKEYMRETKGGMDAQLGSYANSFMRPNFGIAGERSWESQYGRQWRSGGLLGGESGWMMYKDALPTEFELHPEDPIKGNDWMKLHEKNPLFLSKFLNAQGLPLTARYSGLRAGAHSQLLLSVERAKHLGLLPLYGNPYHFKNEARRPTPRVSNLTRDYVENYRSQWVENERIKQHFREIKRITSELKRSRSSMQGAQVRGGLPHFPPVVNRKGVYDHKRFHYAVQHVNPLDTV